MRVEMRPSRASSSVESVVGLVIVSVTMTDALTKVKDFLTGLAFRLGVGHNDGMTDPEDYGTKLRDARRAKHLSIETATFRVCNALGRTVSTRTVGRLETGVTSEDSADDVLFVALCRIYEVDPMTISPAITARAYRSALVLVGTKGTDGPDDEAAGGSRTTSRYAQKGADRRERVAA